MQGWRQVRSFGPLPCDKFVGLAVDPDPLHLDAGLNLQAGRRYVLPKSELHPTLVEARETGEEARGTRQVVENGPAEVWSGKTSAGTPTSA